MTHHSMIEAGIPPHEASKLMHLLNRSPLSAEYQHKVWEGIGLRVVRVYDKKEAIEYFRSKKYIEYVKNNFKLLDKI